MIQDNMKSPPIGEMDGNFLFNWLHILAYDFVLWFFSLIIHTYFRDIESRGVQYIPKTGPIVFVIAPHANQFVDPLVVMTKVKDHADRRISFLIAAKSFRQRFIGFAAQLTGAIPVERAQDILKAATGKIKVEEFDEETVITGEGTKFETECMAKGLIGLPNSLGNAQIDRIESDTRLILKKPIKVNRKSPSEKDAKVIKMLEEGTSFKTAPHIDNDVVFRNVFKHLNDGKVLGIFPEGGSHDRPSLLPLKAGVAIMALGAAATSENSTNINVIPVGLNYFHPHKFRSRAVVEFGKPIIVDHEMGQEYSRNSKQAISNLLATITAGLNEVTVTCNDYDIMMALQAARRLYTSNDRENIPISMVVEMNRRLVKGYEKYSEDPELIRIKEEVSAYNKKLKQMGLHDYQVDGLTSSNRLKTFVMFADRLFKVFLFLGLSLPGVFLFSPVFIVGKRISKRKAKEALAGSLVKIKANDVLATWKILVAMGLAPALYVFYSIIGTILIVKSQVLSSYYIPTWFIFLICYGWSVLTTYASLRIGEIGVDYYKSLKPLFYSVLSHHLDVNQIQKLKEQRKHLSKSVTDFCNSHGPGLFDDYEKFYREYNNIQDDYYSESDSSTKEESAKIAADKGPTSSVSFFQGLSDLDNLNLTDNLGDVPIFSRIIGEDDSFDEEGEEESAEETEDHEKVPDKEAENKEQTNSKDSHVRQRRTKADN
ncbi:glycerol-3-phosphate O-acyltransferase 2 [[Candida] railenensis]|uniref:Glycerol-3-phosphate O-acyltransferase 2 n=1 Tax=[Candida] railenensis TaxID=45579 RepID=A0A9P0QR77_9ASCO|nr:glycerol-3-phosphate O-acyltransferase 2 [[Candida] railenensis]